MQWQLWQPFWQCEENPHPHVVLTGHGACAVRNTHPLASTHQHNQAAVYAEFAEPAPNQQPVITAASPIMKGKEEGQTDKDKQPTEAKPAKEEEASTAPLPDKVGLQALQRMLARRARSELLLLASGWRAR